MVCKMIYRLYSVYDSKVSDYSMPFYDIKDAGAIRKFADAVKDGSNPNNLWHNHPEDYSLWVVGEFETSNGEVIPVRPVNLINASAIMSVVPIQPELFNENGKKEKNPAIK